MDLGRFISFKDTQGIEHTVRVVDIQAVGLGAPNGTPLSYIRFHDFPLTVNYGVAAEVKRRWLQEG